MPRAAVIGKGLFGVGAALHLSRAGWEVVLIGPDEPAANADYSGPFAAHFDEARILVARGNRAEIDLTIQTILGLMQLQDESGQSLITHSGSIEVFERGTGVELLDGVVNVGAAGQYVEVAPPQGFYNPRAYVRAGVGVLQDRGVEIVREAAHAIRRVAARYEVETAGTHTADKVVVAAGAWSNRLFADPLALRLKREHVLFAEIAADQAAAIQMRPTVFYGMTGAVEDIYTLPPLLYPDGNWYMKLGANTSHDQAVAQDDSIDLWYRSGDSSVAEVDLAAAFRTVFPEVPVLGFHTERCVITYTPHGRPYIDEVEDGLIVCTGGNGHGASWADGSGRLAAALATGQHWEGFDRQSFAAVRQSESLEWPRPLLMSERS